VLRGACAVGLAASALWLALSPHADQPLFDAIESLAPDLRAGYMSASERAVYQDADAYAERYRLQIERLNATEADSRWQGRALDDFEVRRISSFLQSYGEMRKGEEFVKREVRSRARERSRGWLGATLILLALLAYPEAIARMRRLKRVRSR
jgi:zinc/manganese transport system permease protein